jgi:mannosyltransferase OCH1-like enzyme
MFVNKKKQLIQKQKQQNFQKLKDEIRKKIENNINILNYNSMINKPFILKPEYKSIIPLHLYTCWHTKDLPPLMKVNYEYLVESNPKITFHLYDENDCREFIKNNFGHDVLHAYDSLIPCSYKSDLWRFCVLFINGGIYMDIKYRCINGFKFIDLTEKEYFVRDYNINDTYNALIVALPGNDIIHKCIKQIVENVKNKYYGNGCLDPTGPGLLAKYFTQEERNYMELYHGLVESINKYYIVKDDRIILCWYNGYRDEQSKFQKLKHYSQLWDERNIYK